MAISTHCLYNCLQNTSPSGIFLVSIPFLSPHTHLKCIFMSRVHCHPLLSCTQLNKVPSSWLSLLTGFPFLAGLIGFCHSHSRLLPHQTSAKMFIPACTTTGLEEWHLYPSLCQRPFHLSHRSCQAYLPTPPPACK